MARRFDEIDAQLANPTGAFDQARYAALLKERALLEPPVDTYRRLRDMRTQIEANDLLVRQADGELRALAEEENAGLRERVAELEQKLSRLMMPRDPNDSNDVFVEIRAGTGGDEAAIFAGDLARMYMRFAEAKGMKTELVSESPSEAGGYKEIVFAVKGNEPYRFLKHESGVHRVQRVPTTEAQGRIHTSTATVAVLPQVEDDDEIEIKPAEFRDRHLQSLRRRRPIRQQNGVRHTYHARSDGHRGQLAAGAIAAAKSREGDADASSDALRSQAPRAGRGGRLDAALASRQRRARREDSNL